MDVTFINGKDGEVTFEDKSSTERCLIFVERDKFDNETVETIKFIKPISVDDLVKTLHTTADLLKLLGY